MATSIVVLSIIGILISIYALYTESKSKKDKTYKPVCDINDRMSCSKAFDSPAGKLFFNIPNPIPGIGAYALIIIFTLLGYDRLTYFLISVAALISIYLGTVLIRMRNICVVCTSIYVVNILLLIYGYFATF